MDNTKMGAIDFYFGQYSSFNCVNLVSVPQRLLS